MASGDERASAPDLDGSGLRIAIIASRWNAAIVDRLVDGAVRGLESFGVSHIEQVSVPGAFELPMAARLIAGSDRIDGSSSSVRSSVAKPPTTNSSPTSVVAASRTCSWKPAFPSASAY